MGFLGLCPARAVGAVEGGACVEEGGRVVLWFFWGTGHFPVLHRLSHKGAREVCFQAVVKEMRRRGGDRPLEPSCKGFGLGRKCRGRVRRGEAEELTAFRNY